MLQNPEGNPTFGGQHPPGGIELISNPLRLVGIPIHSSSKPSGMCWVLQVTTAIFFSAKLASKPLVRVICWFSKTIIPRSSIGVDLSGLSSGKEMINWSFLVLR
jgi:hypothetical protein